MQILQLLRVGLQAFVALGVIAIVDAFHFVHGLFFERVILGADGLGPFERHVLEHVRDAGFPARIVHRAGVDVGVEGNDRRLVPLENDEVQAVGEGEFGDALLKVLQRLRNQRQRAQQ